MSDSDEQLSFHDLDPLVQGLDRVVVGNWHRLRSSRRYLPGIHKEHRGTVT
jgi:hypothetical protein